MYYVPGQPVDQGPPSLRTAVTTIHRDPGWWHKLLVGGLVWLTGIGTFFVEGYQIESLDNTRNGFPVPLPPWRAWGVKAIQGMFSLVIDFFYFVFPLLVGMLLWGCGTILLVTFASGIALRPVAFGIAVIVVLWLAVAWFVGVSPVAKQFFVNEGLPNDALSSKVVRSALAASSRGLYFRARIHSIPPYLVAVGLFATAWYARAWGTLPALALLWLALAALLYARLITIQLFQAAAQQIERRRWEARRAARS